MTNRDYRENYIRLIKLKKNGKIDENGKLYNKDDTLYANENQKNTENDIGLEHISSYPNNINFKNFFYFLIAPTFCYQESYPSSGKFRPVYFILKLLKAFFCLTLIYFIYSESIKPTLPNILNTHLLLLIIELYFPITIFCLICFYLIFECILPGYAELATFGDRQFYDDWWNSTDLAEFNRRWNKVVHMWLYRHVYLECKNKFNCSKLTATSMTFLVSAIFHEYCLCILIKLFRPILFVMMIIQIPMITIGRKFFNNTTFGNLFFWFSNLLGLNLIFIIYNREYFIYYGTIHD